MSANTSSVAGAEQMAERQRERTIVAILAVSVSMPARRAGRDRDCSALARERRTREPAMM